MDVRHQPQPLAHSRSAIAWLCLGILSVGTGVERGQAAGQATGPTTSGAAAETLSAERMMEDIRRLASPEFNGRQTATVDDLHSAAWVADRFRSFGLHPGAPNPLHAGLQQPWMMVGSANAPTIPPTLALTVISGTTITPLQVGRDYLPLLDSPPADLTAPVTFVGYGLVDPARGYDDYQRLNVAGHLVLLLRGKPSWYEGQLSYEAKVRLARQHGAVGVLMVTGPVMSAYESRRGVGTTPLAFYGRSADGEAPSLPGAWITVAAAEQILSQTTDAPPTSLASLQEEIHQRVQPRSRPSQVEVRIQWETHTTAGSLQNVVGFLKGSDPALADEAVVIGAHRDHFGRQAGLLFAGADDNASGTAVVLEVARNLAATGHLKRTIVFVSFSGEEQGLLGSRLYVAHPSLPLGKTRAMINIDHAGIGNGRLTVGVTGLDKAAAEQAGQAAGLADKLDLFGFFPGGDHVPFKEAGVPTVTVVSGGAHPHFHQPTDNVETLKPDIVLAVARYVLALATQLAQ